MTNPKIPDQSALLYRQGHLTGIPAIPGGTSPVVTELLYLNQYDDAIVSTLPHTDLGHGITSPGQVTEVTYVNAYVASANFRAMLITHTQPGEDGWTVADLDHFEPGDLSTLRPDPNAEVRRIFDRARKAAITAIGNKINVEQKLKELLREAGH